jgi:Fic/DOC family protein
MHMNGRPPAGRPAATPEYPAFAVTAEQLRALEARYQPIRPFADWRHARVDARRWTRHVDRLNQARADASADAWSAVQRRLLRLASFDTGALDGLYPANPELSIRIADPTTSTEAPLEVVSGGLAAFVASQRDAYQFALEAATGGTIIDQAWIRGLHEILTAPQETYLVVTPEGERMVPMDRGRYRADWNFREKSEGVIVAYAPASLVATEVQRLVEQLQSAEFAAAHPAVQAAYAHHATSQIHPFPDANGRVARSLASVYLLRAAGVPLVVLADQWTGYLQAERRTDDGPPQPLVDFVFARGIDIIDLAANLFVPSPGGMLKSAQPDALEPPAVDVLERAATRLVFDGLWTELRERLVTPPDGVRLATGLAGHEFSPAAPNGWRSVEEEVTGNRAVVLALAVDRPGSQPVERRFTPLVALDPDDVMPVGIQEQVTGSLLELSLGDLHPLFSEMATIRLRAWVSAQVSGAYRELEQARG